MSRHVAVGQRASRYAGAMRSAMAALAALALVHGTADAQQEDSLRRARVIGRVVDGGGFPIARAEVFILRRARLARGRGNCPPLEMRRWRSPAA